jgi:3-deoxy-manno-octulosonate cytidylyltransferase (CMP-KDO synthetase)
MPCAVIIPARFASSRFPGKPLHHIAGKPLVQHVWERCRLTSLVDRILVATDDPRIASTASAFGAEVVMTSPHHQSGTDRIAEAAHALPDHFDIINVQGDEPLINPALVDDIARFLRDGDRSTGMVTAVHPLDDAALLENPNIVKCVLSRSGRALYFSRSTIPHPRTHVPDLPFWRHMGIYGYRRAFLHQFVQWPPSPLEISESLEQLRALENDASIHCIVTSHDSPGIDTPEQARDLESLIAARLNQKSSS